MNIIACTYINLWPFANRTVSLVIHPWAAMIIAPVGTGKSMLFFDGIIYGLYKYSTRDIINNACQTGSVSMLIEIDGEYWLIRRDLKATKARSISTTSSLSRWHGDVDQIYADYVDIIYANRDIVWSLVGHADPIIFKNETDLQKNLEEFLPARDVFMNRDMMMQESSNIFDLTQTERITVFKHLFWLLDIDAAKDRLAEEKIKLKYLLQAKKDTSWIATKFDQGITTLKQSWGRLQSSELINIADHDGQSLQFWLDASSILATTISIDKVSMIQRDQSAQIRSILEWSKQQYHELQAQLTQLKQQKAEFINQNSQLVIEQVRIEKEQEQAQTVIKTYNLEQLQTYKSEKLSIIQQINELEFAIDYDAFDENIEDLAQAHNYVTKLTQQGKELQLQITNIQTQTEGIQHRQELEITNHTAKIVWLDGQITQFDEQIKLKQEKLDIASRFYCIKIEADCPFVSQINEWVFTAHAREIEQIINHKAQLLTQKQWLETHKPVTDYAAHLTRLTWERSQLEDHIKQLRTTLVTVGFKQISESYPHYQQLQSQLKILDQQIAQYEHKLTEIDEMTKKLQTLEMQQQQMKVEGEKLKTQSEQIDIQLQTITQQSQAISMQYRQIGEYELQLQQLVDQIRRINDLISDYKSSQQEIIILETRSKRIDELYTIVSKELTVLVLQEQLPLLSDIINNQLAKVVDYRLEFTVNISGDKLEIMIIDQYGSREVKSLSGWQRAILRLCWILAIALWSGNKFLFLDETINHLDKDMISSAAELIEEFVQWNKVTLYAITHSEQIQMLDIWDYVVQVKEVL